MDLILCGAGRREVSLEVMVGEREADVLQLAHALGLDAPEYAKLAAAWYGSLTMSPPEVVQLRSETEELLRRYLEQRRAEVQREKRVHARSPQVLAGLLDGLLAGDPWRLKLTEIVGLCDEAIAGGEAILCVGD